jgi:hypothetical protein
MVTFDFNVTTEDVQKLCAMNPLAQEQLFGILKDRRIAELEAALVEANGAKAEAEVPAGRG